MSGTVDGNYQFYRYNLHSLFQHFSCSTSVPWTWPCDDDGQVSSDSVVHRSQSIWGTSPPRLVSNRMLTTWLNLAERVDWGCPSKYTSWDLSRTPLWVLVSDRLIQKQLRWDKKCIRSKIFIKSFLQSVTIKLSVVDRRNLQRKQKKNSWHGSIISEAIFHLHLPCIHYIATPPPSGLDIWTLCLPRWKPNYRACVSRSSCRVFDKCLTQTIIWLYTVGCWTQQRVTLLADQARSTSRPKMCLQQMLGVTYW